MEHLFMKQPLQLSELIDLSALQKMVDTHYMAAGIPFGLLDARDNTVLVAAGWSLICKQFHRINPLTLSRCQESDNYIKSHLVEGEACQYICKNGLVDIGIPVLVAGQHLATLFIGQFFYEGEVPDREIFVRQAQQFGFDQDAYLAALDLVPVYSHEKIEIILDYDKSLVVLIAALAENALSRIKSDRSLRLAQSCVDTASDSIFWIRTDSRIIEVNAAACRYLGYSRNELRQLSVHDINLAYSDKTDAWMRHIEKIRQDGSIKFDAMLRSKGGDILSVEIVATLFSFEDEEFICSFVRDISERLEQEKERLKLGKLESLGVLAGGIAHDFNNILTGVIGNISFAMALLDSEHAAYKRLQEADQASLRAAELAQQLLIFAKGGDPVKKVVSASKILTDSLSLMLRGSNVRGVANIPDDLQSIKADAGQMSQAFNNIILNAAQSMPGGGVLTISARNETLGEENTYGLPPGNYVQILFDDHGCGIPESDLARIFDPYFTTKPSGSGLGLASTYSIVSQHGGKITVTSTVGRGTTFTIYLPSESETVEAPIPSSDQTVANTASGGRILVMEDEEPIQELVGEILDYIGYQSKMCKDGEEAIRLYRDAMESGQPFLGVIMDLTIPGGMGGKEASEGILAIDPAARLIVSSGYSSDPIMADYSKHGFAAAITKPYGISEFTGLIHSLFS